MKPYRRGQVAIVCILLGSAAGSIAQQPIPKEKKSPNCVELADEAMKLWQRDIDAYRRYTKDPQRLRPQAEEFLRAVLDGQSPCDRGPGAAKTRAMGKNLIGQGCNDPLVKAYYAVVCSKTQEGLGVFYTLSGAVEGLQNSGYPPECRRIALLAYCERGMGGKALPRWNDIFNETIRLVTARLSDTTITPVQQRILLEELAPFFRDSTGTFMWDMDWRGLATLNKACEKLPKADPWTVNMLLGHYHCNMARSRMSGWLHDRTPKGIKLRKEDLLKAREHFGKALKLHPDFPEAAVGMLAVALLRGSDRTPRQWFDTAVAAQVDYPQAYLAMRAAVSPNWRGDIEQMYRFGCECADTERYDTAIPFVLVQAVNDIKYVHYRNSEAWKRPGAYAKMKRVLESMAREPFPSGPPTLPYESGKRLTLNRPALMSIHAAVAGLAGQYADARRLLDELGSRLDRDAFDYWCVDPENRLATIYTLTGKGSADFKRALKMVKEGVEPLSNAVLHEAKKLFRVAFDADDNPYSRAYCQCWIDLMDEYLTFNSGQWVDKKFDAKLLGWQTVAGSWSMLDAHTAAGSSKVPASSVMLSPVMALPRPLEVEFELKASDQNAWERRIGANIREKLDKLVFSVFYVNTTRRKWGVKMLGKTIEKKIGLYTNTRFRIQLANGRAVFYVNDELCTDQRDPAFRPTNVLLRFGSRQIMRPYTTYFLHNVRIRKWDPTKESPKFLDGPKLNPG